jgi:tRNA-modifying protein YgfZ
MLESVAATDTDLLAAEHRALRDVCGLIDRSERGKLALSGAGAVEFLNGQVTNELNDLRAGEGCYAAFLTHKGKMLGDLRVLAVAPGAAPGSDAGVGTSAAEAPAELLLDTERVALQTLFDMVRRFKVGYDVELHKRTLEYGLLSLIGPEADRVAGVASPLAVASGIEPDDGIWLQETEHASAPLTVGGIDVLAIRTDIGVDLLCESSDTERLRKALIERGAQPVSDVAAECVRIERGRPRYGLDLDETTIPQEAGLNERAVSFTKGCYVGQETVARLHWKGKPNRHLRGLRLSAPATTGEELRLGERSVGRLGSVAASPEHGPIALALVRREAPPGARVAVGEHGNEALVVELPFAPTS